MDFLGQEYSLLRAENDYNLEMDLACIYLESGDFSTKVKEVCKKIITAILKFIDRLATMVKDLFMKVRISVSIAKMKKKVRENPSIGKRKVILRVNTLDSLNYTKHTREVMRRVNLYLNRNNDSIISILEEYEDKLLRLNNTDSAYLRTETVDTAIVYLESCVKDIDADFRKASRDLMQFYKTTDTDNDYIALALSKISNVTQKIKGTRAKMMASDLADVMDAVYSATVLFSRKCKFDGTEVVINVVDSYDKYGAYTKVQPNSSVVQIYLTKSDLRLPTDELTTIVAHELGHNLSSKGYRNFEFDVKKEVRNIQAAQNDVRANVNGIYDNARAKTEGRLHTSREHQAVIYTVKEADADVYALRTFARADFSKLDQYVKDNDPKSYQEIYQVRANLRNVYKV